MKIGLLSLRTEFPVSGEFKSTLALCAMLRDLGVDVAGQPDPAGRTAAFGWRNIIGWQHFARLRAALQAGDCDYHLVKIPTVAQLPLVRLLAPADAGRVLVLLDSVCSNRASRGPLRRELRHEPAYALAKRCLNHGAWGRLARGFRPRAVIGCAEEQIREARAALAANQDYRVIPNASPGEPAARPPRPAGRPLVVGYLGPAVAYKGSAEIIEAARHLRQPDRFVFRAAFNYQGSAGIRRLWQQAGVRDEGVVDAGAFLASIDVLCVPLYCEYGTKTFPNLLLEAMQAGLPVVTTRLPVFTELLGADAPLPLLERVSGPAIARALESLASRDLSPVSAYLRSRHRQFSQAVIRDRWATLLADLSHAPRT